MSKIQKIERQQKVKTLMYTTTVPDIAQQLKTTVRTIYRDINQIIEQDINKINTNNVIHKLLNDLKNIQKHCQTLSQDPKTTPGIQIKARTLESKIIDQILDALQKTNIVEKAADKIDVSMREEYKTWFTKRPMKIKTEDIDEEE